MDMMLEDGARIGVIGGGPAGSLFAIFLLAFAERIDLALEVEIFEPRDFSTPGPRGCNMCGGIISETLVQYLATEGITLPDTVLQRGLDAYRLHTSDRQVEISTPGQEKRIAAIHRGGGPRDAEILKWGGFDGFLLGLAGEAGARTIAERVREITREDGFPVVTAGGERYRYDLLAGATGVNSPGTKLFEDLGFGYERPATTKTFITELALGEDEINRLFGNAMNLFLTDLPGMHFAAIIPKGEYATVCLLGDEIDQEMIDGFFASLPVRHCFGGERDQQQGACHCSPKINVGAPARAWADRIVLLGDAGATRLYKDGIGGAYRCAKAAARTAVFAGVSVQDFEQHFRPAYRAIVRDNRYGRLIFRLVDIIHRFSPLTRGTMKMVAAEQARSGSARRMSTVMWDMFTGSAPYRNVFWRCFSPLFWVPFLFWSLLSLRRPPVPERS